MRLLASIIIILILIIGSGFWTNHALQTTSNKLTQQIDKISNEIKGNQWPEAIQQNKNLEKTWKDKAKWWPVILDHQEIDNIEFSLAKVKEYVANRNTALSQGQLSELKLMIEHIPRKETVNLENIL